MRKVIRTAILAVVLGLVAIVIPDSTPAPTEFTLVKLAQAEGVDHDPDVIWILAVGSDARPREDPLRTRGDALQLIGMDTRTGAATAIGIPRDSWVQIPGHGSNRVNAALFFGGPKALGRTEVDARGLAVAPGATALAVMPCSPSAVHILVATSQALARRVLTTTWCDTMSTRSRRYSRTMVSTSPCALRSSAEARMVSSVIATWSTDGLDSL